MNPATQTAWIVYITTAPGDPAEADAYAREADAERAAWDEARVAYARKADAEAVEWDEARVAYARDAR